MTRNKSRLAGEREADEIVHAGALAVRFDGHDECAADASERIQRARSAAKNS